MEFLKKPREPWEIGIDSILASDGMIESFYFREFRDSTREQRQTQSTKALQAFKYLTGVNIGEDSFNTVSKAASLRNEFAGQAGAKPKRVKALISHICDASLSTRVAETKDLQKNAEYLSSVALEHNKAQARLKTVEIPIKEDFTLLIGYDSTNWEGLGAVYFAFEGVSDDLNPVPVFAVRGNPNRNIQTGDNEFHFRGVQSWVSDRHSSLVGLTELIEAKRTFSPRKCIQEICSILEKRADMLRQLENVMLADKSNGARSGFFFACALTYLHTAGFVLFRGIQHEHHPDVLKPKCKIPMSFNYDDFWKKLGLDKDSGDEIHPWVASPDLIDDISAGSFTVKLRPAGRAVLNCLRTQNL